MKNLCLLAVCCLACVMASRGETCSDGEFRCNDDGACIPSYWRCDDDNDCPDGEDETGCDQTAASCDPDYFHCGDGECIPSSWRCDGGVECTNRADERNCPDRK